MERGDLGMEYLGTEYVVIVHRDELRAGLVQSAQRQRSVLASVRLRRWLASRLHRPVAVMIKIAEQATGLLLYHGGCLRQ